MKKLSAYLILAILFINSAGFFVYYAVQLQAIKREMRALMKTLPDEKLEIIRLSLNDFEASKTEEDEIQWRGKMFDIARMQTDGSEVILYGLYDEKESDLLTFLDHIISQPEFDKSTLPGIVVDFIALQFIPSEARYYENLRESKLISHQTRYTKAHASTLIDTLENPPRFIVF